MNKEKPCQGKNSDSAKKFVRMPLIAIRGGPVLYTPENALPRGLRAGSSNGEPRTESPLRGGAAGLGYENPRATEAWRFDSVRRFGENRSLRGGGVAQLGEHHVRNVGVEGSNPFSSTTFFPVRLRLPSLIAWRPEPG